ncbi:M56 family metallopeptidase [Neobacillus sp. 179-C4.2 HS]|uniref:M56 family metallopeptidase n=1 Tax=Neobacillus driksii TaxID=3035913 RepID=A0ABV4YZJ9_9BACI|nr:M56 family metallopeptidase [Neobacillus sp. 179.-C4.2 HS]MDP5194583.1 M56 family metallopeptidase [Neobacillus sp. 179.-C4.2 HS]
MIDTFLDIYLPRFFGWVIETSIMASILVALILGVKILLRNRLTPRWHYLLWMILMVRLILPWSPDSSYSIYSILSRSYEKAVSVQSQSAVAPKNEPIQETTTGISGTMAVTGAERNPADLKPIPKESQTEIPFEKQKEEPISLYSIALYIWLTGIILLSFVTCLLNRQLYQYIQQQPAITDKRIINIFENSKQSMSVQQNIPLLHAGKISSPTVLGFFRPRILLSNVYSNQLTDQQLRHIFYHELAHIKRRDIAANWLMHSLLILNWFNPILWYAYVCMREDQELACDAYALTFMEEEEKISYGYTIISLLEHYSNYYQTPSLANLSRNKRTLKRRIFMIKRFQKKSYGWSILGIVAVLIISSVSLLNAQADGSNVKQVKQAETKETATAEVESNGFDPRMKKFIAEQAEEFKNTTDRFEYNAKIEKLVSQFANQYTGYPSAEAAYDFENFRRLMQWGSIFNFSYQEQNGFNSEEQIAQVTSVVEYLKQLLNDLDVVMNKNGKGETFGVLHQLDGEHVLELEKLAYGEQGFPAELKEYNSENFKIVEVESSRLDPRWKQFIAEQAEEFNNTTDINEYFSKIQQIDQEFRKQSTFFYTVEAYLDFENLRTFIGAGLHFNHSISNQKQQGIEKVEYGDDYKRIFDYTRQLLNDLDVVMNKNGKGDTFGVLHQLDGEHVIELEKFANREQGSSAALRDYYTQLIEKRK